MGQVPPSAWSDLFSDYRIGTFRGQQVVRGTLRPEAVSERTILDKAVASWPGLSYLHEPDGIADATLVLIGEPPAGERPRLWLHVALFALTAFTTLMAGALLQGVDPLGARPLHVGPAVLPLPTGLDPWALLRGASFAIPLLAILLAHEMAHYFAARLHRVRVTPPFFLPFPAYYSIVGTLGAFIRIKGPTVRRSILLDIGAAGPVASFVLSVPVLVVGLALSRATPVSLDGVTPFLIRFAGQPIWLGTSPIIHLIAGAVGDQYGQATLVLHPIAFAGWLGLFVTALNLLPLGQLDGGHILYALAPRRQLVVARLFILALVPLGSLWWGWWFWALAAVAVSRGRLRHPPLLQEGAPLTRGRRWVAWAAIFVFFFCFPPVPIVF